MEKTRFEQFLDYGQNSDKYAEDIRGNGGFDYHKQVTQLIALSNNMNYRLLVYLFGDQIGQHMAQKYLNKGRDLLAFLGSIDGPERFFLLHELKTNETLFAHC